MTVSLQLALQYLSFKYTASSCGAHCRFHFCKYHCGQKWRVHVYSRRQISFPEDISKIKNFIITAHGMWMLKLYSVNKN